MNEQLQLDLDSLPSLPGVYLMKNQEGKVIYVGKAKNLKNRVRSYFVGADERIQVAYLIKRVERIEKIVTASEQQALTLERDLITKYKPRYNIKLKDDKAYISIRVDLQEEWPRLELVRKRNEDDGARYFGPYSFSYEIKTLLGIIKKVIPLRTCNNTVFHNRIRPCLEYQIKRCAGPCCLPVEKAQYRKWLKQAIALLEGKTETLVKDLTVLMEEASTELRFEAAAEIRDKLDVLTQVQESASLVSSRGEMRDLFALYREEQLASLVIILVRNGRVSDSISYSFSDVEIPDNEIISGAISQFYEKGREIPPEVVVPCELEQQESIAEMLSEKKGKAVSIVLPERGIKSRLLELAMVNAREQFEATFDAESRYREIAKRLATLSQLKQLPRRIECVDISNLQGSNTVGAIVSFFDGHPDKERYRKYKLQNYDKPDDFAAIHEVVGRRIERGIAEDSLPDLLIIDGGKQQLNMALEARDALGAELDIIALAKMRTERNVTAKEVARSHERLFIPGSDLPIELADDDILTHLVARIRDEVHRFVITFHRSERSKKAFTSVLDSIAGIGSLKRAALLSEFGSIELLKRASAEEISQKAKISVVLAERVLEALREE